jgi:N-methylhydantoinase A
MRLGVDVGGTFTDLVLLDPRDGRLVTVKVPTNVKEPLQAIIEGVPQLLALARTTPRAVDIVSHGTTIATNLLVEGKGAKTALITTEGFRDVLEFRRTSRHDRADLYDMFYTNPPDLVPRHLRRGVRERILFDGTIETPLDGNDLQAKSADFADQGIEAVAVCFLHSYIAPSHEREAVSALAEQQPDLFVTPSHEVDPQMEEYERVSTTIINAMLGPRCSAYFSRIEDGLMAIGIAAPLNLMQSNGGLTAPEVGSKRPVSLLSSGPAGGVTAAAAVCRLCDVPKAITGDMGGTTFDVAMIRDFRPEVRTEAELNTHVVRTPTIDIVSIGAGGGSIVRIDKGGRLNVGPESVGADPGPACYGRGGTQATVTDCNLLLGYLDPASVIGGRRLQPDLARQAVEEHVAGPLGVSVHDAALMARTIANTQMGQAMRLVTVERGFDPRDFWYFPYGGGGPIHAIDLARELGIRHVLVPALPSLFSAFGMTIADFAVDHQEPVLKPLAVTDADELRARFRKLEAKAMDDLATASIPADRCTSEWRLDCRYIGQPRSLTFDVGTELDAASIRRRFSEEHQRLWGFDLPTRPIFVENVRIRAVGRISEDIKSIAEPAIVDDVPSHGRRPVYLGGQWASLPCYDRAKLQPGSIIVGPAIIEEATTNFVLTGRETVHVDRFGNMIAELS